MARFTIKNLMLGMVLLPAVAFMSTSVLADQPFVGEIRLVGFNFAPSGWMFCDGSLIPISENEVLFNLIGTTYGGDGQQTFALPDLRGRTPIGTGSNGSNNYFIGESGGQETVTLTVAQLPVHTHVASGQLQFTAQIPAVNAAANSGSPAGNTWAVVAGSQIYSSRAPTISMSTSALSLQSITANTNVANAGSSQPHENRMPFLVINYIISLFGVFPSQN